MCVTIDRSVMTSTTIFANVFGNVRDGYSILQGYVNNAQNIAVGKKNCMILPVDGTAVQVPGASLSGGDDFMPGFNKDEHQHLGRMFYGTNKCFLQETYVPTIYTPGCPRAMGGGRPPADGVSVIQQGIYTIVKVELQASDGALEEAINGYCSGQLESCRGILAFYRAHYKNSTLLLCFFDTPTAQSCPPILYTYQSSMVRIPLLDAHDGCVPKNEPCERDQVIFLYDYTHDNTLTPATLLRPDGRPRHEYDSTVCYPKHADVMVCKIDPGAYRCEHGHRVNRLDFGKLPNGDMVIDLNNWFDGKREYESYYVAAAGTTTVSTYYPSAFKTSGHVVNDPKHMEVASNWSFNHMIQFPGGEQAGAGPMNSLASCSHFIRQAPSSRSPNKTVQLRKLLKPGDLGFEPARM
tara:strand:+ start:17790 stop:19013 length:1224 start_codon:yes stop_codon:yes gene_type:complete